MSSLSQIAVDKAYTSGLVIKSATSSEAIHAPFSLKPSEYPREAYDKIIRIQPIFNTLVDAVARDDKFIQDMMSRYTYSSCKARLIGKYLHLGYIHDEPLRHLPKSDARGYISSTPSLSYITLTISESDWVSIDPTTCYILKPHISFPNKLN